MTVPEWLKDVPVPTEQEFREIDRQMSERQNHWDEEAKRRGWPV